MKRTNYKETVILIAFYNIKALGVRYLESALRNSGYNVITIFYKGFNSIRPQPTNDAELKILTDIIKKENPLFVGYSVMSSMYLETVNLVNEAVRSQCPNTKTLCGGAFATMFPEYFLSRGIDFVLQTDGEISICQLADCLLSGEPWYDIPSLSYMKEGAPFTNAIGNVLASIDEYGMPAIECKEAYFIENSKLVPGDPQLSTMSYEVIASRGCPFSCSYCCCINLRRLFPKGMKYVRTRSVKSVMEELMIAKKKLKKLVFIHFYDEIFPNQPGWVDDFVREYKKHINLPFTIWSHPKMTSRDDLKKLVSAGLVEVIMGIQSGSERVRRDVFHRYETQDEIIESTKYIREAGVFWASYDFMLQHPFETIEDLKQTYFLVKKLHAPFELQLHGLNFLPGTDIVDMAVEQGIITKENMDAIMYAPMADQFKAYWKQENEPLSQLWYRMIYCLQYPSLRKKIEAFEGDPEKGRDKINSYYGRAQKKSRLRYYWKKANIALKRIIKQ